MTIYIQISMNCMEEEEAFVKREEMRLRKVQHLVYDSMDEVHGEKKEI